MCSSLENMDISWLKTGHEVSIRASIILWICVSYNLECVMDSKLVYIGNSFVFDHRSG